MKKSATVSELQSDASVEHRHSESSRTSLNFQSTPNLTALNRGHDTQIPEGENELLLNCFEFLITNCIWLI